MTLALDEQLERIASGTEEILPAGELRTRLAATLAAGRPLRVKMGFDPSAPDIHLGHAIGLRKLRLFQTLGHHVVLIVGDYTGMVGDPTGRTDTRPRLTHDKVKANAQTYLDQFFRIVDRERAEVVWNGDWFSRLSFSEVMELASRFTVARLLERDDFTERFREGRPISIHELFYPIMQGYDSVMVRSDVEIGGTDQKFNLLMGRTLQEAHGQAPQIILTLPILVGTDGVQRMSKSLGNYVGIQEPPREMFGKLMSIPDSLIHRYFELCTDRDPRALAEIARRLSDPQVNPRDVKAELARDVVGLYHGEEAAETASQEFDRMFRHGEAPDEIPLVQVVAEEGGVPILRALAEPGLVKSRAEARRLIRQGGVKVDGSRVDDENLALAVRGEPYRVQVGRRTWALIQAVAPGPGVGAEPR